MTFGQKLQQLRKSRGLSQEDLAGQLSVTRQTISKWELDQSTPDLPYLAAISEFFGVSTDYLIKEHFSEPSHNTAQADVNTVPMQPIKQRTSARQVFLTLFKISLGGIIFPMLIFTIAELAQTYVPYLDSICLLLFMVSTVMAIICGLFAAIAPRQS